MKKLNILFFISLFVISFLILTSISYAGLSSSRFSIGRIKLGYNLNQIKKMYGQPKKIDTEMKKAAAPFWLQNVYIHGGHDAGRTKSKARDHHEKCEEP